MRLENFHIFSQICELMNIKPGSSSSLIFTNFGYGFCVDQFSHADKKFAAASTAGSSGFFSGHLTPSSIVSTPDNNNQKQQLIDLFKKRPFDHLVDDSDEFENDKSSDDFENEFSQSNESLAPSSYAYSGSWCYSDYGEFNKSLQNNLADIESGLAELSIEIEGFQPDRASTPTLAEELAAAQCSKIDRVQPTTSAVADSQPPSSDNEVRTLSTN